MTLSFGEETRGKKSCAANGESDTGVQQRTHCFSIAVGSLSPNSYVVDASSRTTPGPLCRVEEKILFSTRPPHPGPSPRVRGEGDDWERNWKPRVPLELHPGLQVFRPQRAETRHSAILAPDA
jgi:hypothetical protein